MKEKKQASGKRATSISIPAALFEKIQERIRATEFPSVSDYVIHVLDEILAEADEEPIAKKDEELIKARLKALGYID